MKYFFIFLILTTLGFASSNKLIIDATNFETDDIKGLTVFSGNVKLQKDKDRLNSEKLEVFLEPKAQRKTTEAIKYVASGNVSFEIYIKEKIYKGKAEELIFIPKDQEYTISGNAYLKETTEEKELFGDEIFINQLTGNAKVKGSEDKPVRFIINVENNKKNETK